MWFKQTQLFQLTDSLHISPEALIEKLEALAFKPCMPSMFLSMGWVSPIDEEGASLVRVLNGNMMLCLQFEEKILPATVIRQALFEKIRQIERMENRKVYQKEKLSLKDEVIMTLLPRAFTRLTRLYAYIDTKNQWIVLGTANAKKAEQFISMYKKSISEKIYPLELKKLSPIMTHWLKNQSYPSSFSIEKMGVLQDVNQRNRIIRCQQQDLFASSIQSLIKDGCDVKQLGLAWLDRVSFVLSDDFSFHSIAFQDAITAQAKEMEPETHTQQFDADFLIMTDTLGGLFKELLTVFFEPMKVSENHSRVKEAPHH